MKRLLSLALVVAAMSSSAQTTSVSRYIVATRHSARLTPLRVLRDLDEARLRNVREFDNVSGFAADLTADDVRELRQSSQVRYVTPVVERHLLDTVNATPAITRDGSQYAAAQTVPYGIDLVHARQLWPVTKGGKGNINVAIIDTGIDINHPDLKANYAGGYNVIDKTTLPIDDNKHGTHVAGIIAGADNNIGIVGVAPETRLWIVKALDAGGRGFDEDIIAGVDWVISKKKEIGGNWIVSMSFGSDQPSIPEQEAFDRLIDAGVLPVAAAGNTGLAKLQFPGGYPGIFSVGAVDSASKIAPFSSFGPTLAIVAPGVDVVSTLPVASVTVGSIALSQEPASDAHPMVGSKNGEVTAPFVKCGIGMPEDFPAEVAGKIALIQRGGVNYSFAEKVQAAKKAGAIGAIIYNDERPDNFPWTLIRPDCGYPDGCHAFDPDATFDYPVTVALSKADGEKLAAIAGSARPITIGVFTEDYGKLSGTSMATPHVAGVAALVWSLAPKAAAADVRNAITLTATDVGEPGHDMQSGFGLANAYEAARTIAPAVFGTTTDPDPAKPRRRSSPH